jgi:hypothetical protein
MMKLKKHELQNKKKKNQTWVNLLKKRKRNGHQLLATWKD